MKKYPIKYISSISVLFGALFMCLLNSSRLGAQTQVAYQDDRNPKYVDITVTNEGSYIFLKAVGGDGGRKKDGGGHSGGKGALVSGYIKIGNGTGELPVGSTLRFIPGEAGHSWGNHGGGGGGTGIAFRANNNASWQLLAVAGGGGGAGLYEAGRQGASSTNGSNGTNADGSDGSNNGNNFCLGGKNGEGGYEGDDANGGGGGINSDGKEVSPGDGTYSGKRGIVNLVPVGNEGGNSDLTQRAVPGGFGLGSGGSGINTSFFGGGGGGGYSGGGGGYRNGSGGGGGSYLNATFMKLRVSQSRGITLSPQDGYVVYQYVDQLPDKAIKFALNTGKCVDVYGSSTSNGTNIQTYTCHGDYNQQWDFAPDDRTIRSMLNTNKCLSLKDDTGNNGTNIHLWDCKVNDNQRFVYNGLYQTIHSARNAFKCIDAANGSADPKANVNLLLWDCNYSNNNQKWKIDGATTVSNVSTMKYIVPAFHGGYAVHSHTGAESGSNIQLWTKDNTSTAEQWYFDGLAIKMRDHQNLCIDLKSSSTSNGNNIQLYNCNDTNAQQWLYDGMTQSIRSVINQGKCMQIVKNTDGVYGNRSNVEIHDCNGSQEQQFLIQE